MKLLKCSVCGLSVSPKWLFLALPWSQYKCARCGSVFGGTFVRSAGTSVAVLLLGYVLIQVVKGQMNALVLVPALAVAAAVFTLDLPCQTRAVDREGPPDAS